MPVEAIVRARYAGRDDLGAIVRNFEVSQDRHGDRDHDASRMGGGAGRARRRGFHREARSASQPLSGAVGRRSPPLVRSLRKDRHPSPKQGEQGRRRSPRGLGRRRRSDPGPSRLARHRRNWSRTRWASSQRDARDRQTLRRRDRKIIRQGIMEDTADAIDETLLDNRPATAVRPAGLLNGVTPIAGRSRRRRRGGRDGFRRDHGAVYRRECDERSALSDESGGR